MALTLSWVSGYIVLRREVLFTHAISNAGFLGIALAILFRLPITPVLILVCLLAAFLIRFLQSKELFSSDSLLSIFAEIALALGIITIALFPGYRINLEQFLFGDVLGISQLDVIIAIILFLGSAAIIITCHKNFLKISLSESLSHILLKNKTLIHALLIFLLAILIAIAIKIIGVLLVAAFTTIPSNAAKLFSSNLFQTFIFSSGLGLLATTLGLFLSLFTNLPAGPLIVTVLGLFWLLSLAFRRSR